MTNEKDVLLDYRQLSQQLSVSQSYLRKLVMRGMIPFVKINRLVRFRPDDITEWIEEKRRG